MRFPKIKGRILFNEPLSKHTTFRIGGPCKIWAEVEDEAGLKNILTFARSKRKKTFIIGGGSNVLARNKGFNGIIIHLGGRHFKNIKFSGAKVRAGGGAPLSRLVYLVCKKGLRGIEGLVGIPGTVGGAIFMNSGYRQNISDCLEGIKVMDRKKRKILHLKKKNFRFCYRHSGLDNYIILEATFRLKKDNKRALLKRKKELLMIKKNEQPLNSFSAGCVFKNPEGNIAAARYIDTLRLKGKKMGGAAISKIHANFIVNLKNASSHDVLRLVSVIKKRIKSRFNVDLIPEIIII